MAALGWIKSAAHARITFSDFFGKPADERFTVANLGPSHGKAIGGVPQRHNQQVPAGDRPEFFHSLSLVYPSAKKAIRIKVVLVFHTLCECF